MKQKKVLLLGSYGQSNLGDDLLMWNYLELVRARGFNEIYVNANTVDLIPMAVKDAYPNLHIIDTYKTSLFDYLRLIRKVDGVVYGGGTLYKELYASTGRSPYGVTARLAAFNLLTRLLGTRLYHLHIGTGSLKTAMGRWLSKIAINAATLTVFRDQESYDFAKDVLHIPKEKIRKSTDGLFINHIWETSWKQASLKIDQKKPKRVIGINILSDIPDWVDRDRYIAVIKRFVTEQLDQNNHVVFIPFQHDFNPRSDLAFTKEVFGTILKGRRNYTLLSEVPIDQVSSYLRECDVFLGMRFHSLLLATVNQVPYVAIAYDTKCWRFTQETDYRCAIKLEDLEFDNLMELCHEAIAKKSEIKRQLEATTKRMYKEAEELLRTLSL